MDGSRLPPAPVDCTNPLEYTAPTDCNSTSTSVGAAESGANRPRPDPITSPMSSLPMTKKPRSLEECLDDEAKQEECTPKHESIKSPRNDSLDEGERSEDGEEASLSEGQDSFRTWLALQVRCLCETNSLQARMLTHLQRSMGIPLEQVLGLLGLTYTTPDDGNDEADKRAYQEQVWEMLIEMGERLLSMKASPPV